MRAKQLLKPGSELTFFFKRSLGGGGGPGSGYHARTDIFLAALFSNAGIILAGSLADTLDRLVRDLHGETNADYTTYNIFTQFRAFYPFIGGSAAAHSLSLTDPTLHAITWSGSPTHSANGVLTDGVNQEGNTGISSTDLGLYNKCGGIYTKERFTAAGVPRIWGADDGFGAFGLSAYPNGFCNYIGVNSYKSISLVTIDKMSAIDISDSTTSKLYSNGISLTTETPGSTATNETIKVSSWGFPYFTSNSIQTFFVGNSLTDTQHYFLKNAITAYNTALGRN